MMCYRICLSFLLFCIAIVAPADDFNQLITNARANVPHISQPTVLPADEAFAWIPSINQEQQTLELNLQIAPDYYVYKDKLSITAAESLSYTLPAAKSINDEFFGEQAVYFDQVSIHIPIPNTFDTVFSISVHYQGCATAGFCYPPMTKTWEINSQTGAIYTKEKTASASHTPFADLTTLSHSAFNLTEILKVEEPIWAWLIFYALGWLLTFTPCVLPMIPILSTVVVGQQTPPRSLRAFLLSLSYVLGMAGTYAIAGAIAGIAGNTVQSYLQTPIFIGLSALFLILIALSLFDFYHLRLPARWQHHLSATHQRIRGGRYLSAIFLGILSALMVSPCVTAPLIGALTYISATGNAWLGGTALFALALGMGSPLLLIGTLGASLLPRAGDWLLIIQRGLGVLLIAVAISMISRLVSTEMALFLWGSFIVLLASYLGPLQTNVSSGWLRLQQGVAWIMLLCGALIVLGAGRSLLQTAFPSLGFSTAAIEATEKPTFIPVKQWRDVEAIIQQSQKPVLLDFYADWCVTCQIIENQIFPDPAIAPLLSQFVVLRADITQQDADDLALQRQLNVFAPPALLFFAPKGEEIATARLVGEITPSSLTRSLQIADNQRN